MTDDYSAAVYMSDDVSESLLLTVKLLSQHEFTLIEYEQRALSKYDYFTVVSVSQL